MLPIDFKNRMKVLLGEEYEKFEASSSENPVRSFRVNTNKISEENFEKINPFGGEKIPYAENGFYFSCDGIGNHPYHHAGMIYIQEPSAMAPVAGIEIQSDWNILDLCASPGGKSTQAAEKNKDGILVSNEIVPSRCKTLTGNIERMGFRNVITTCADAKKIASLYGEAFDLVIVDAPCSGEGMFRKDENAQKEWSVENVLHCAERQREILDKIKSTVKPGGYLLYSTCTFSPEENEKNVDWFLAENENFELINVDEKVVNTTSDGINFDGCKTENISRCRRFYPHIAKGEGQFLALMKKNDGIGFEELPQSALCEIPKNEQKIIFDFLDETLTDYNKKAVKKYKDNFVYFDSYFPVPNGAFSCGVTIGSLQKKYIKPHHQFFSAMGTLFRQRIELDLDTAKKYIHGETVPCEFDKGWCAVMIDGCPIGGAKAVAGTAKNHYPKGLRTL
ncbi:MAG TPA: RNA methyltransferase [Ruminococcaceae bacterium]|nr:RNA methyltransferase [Oscillospiraceae bacterium]